VACGDGGVGAVGPRSAGGVADMGGVCVSREDVLDREAGPHGLEFRDGWFSVCLCVCVSVCVTVMSQP
jgi:hypothetical protein